MKEQRHLIKREDRANDANTLPTIDAVPIQTGECCPDAPFLFVTGRMSEKIVVEAHKQGAIFHRHFP